MQRGGGQALRRARIGSIFIDIAVVIPVLIAILYYLHDVPKAKRIRKKMEFCAHCGVNMFQNISAKRTDRKITENDIRRIAYSVCLPYFQGKEMLRDQSGVFPHGGFFVMIIIYVKGMGNDTAKIIWTVQSSVAYSSSSSIDTIQYIRNNGDSRVILDTYYTIGRTENSNLIHPKLKINKDEEKMILYVTFYTCIGYKYHDGTDVSAANAGRLFGFYVFPVILKTGSNGLFTASVIFTPNSGLFS
jgi:hypothetical protein